jgi:bla regulator protein blaR1
MNAAYLSPFANHLWQSTVFAGLAGLLTLVLRKNHARVRHSLWLAASFKFLLPLSVLMALGGHIRWRTAAETMPPSIPVVIDEVSQPFTAPAVSSPQSSTPPPPAASPLPQVLWGIWACGFLGITCAWWVRWRRLQAVVCAGSPLKLEIPIQAISSSTLLEPGVFGIFRPVLLLPEGIFDRLTPAQLEAVIAHELCHVRHRDNSMAAIHMFVETAFWFHPLVWWIGKRMVEERERACDEEVLRLGSEPRVYAEGLLNVCKLYVESPLLCVAGVTGANLKRRIEAIMTNQHLHALNRAKKFLLATAAVATLAAPIAIGLVIGAGNASLLRGQPPAQPLAQTPTTAPAAAPIQTTQAQTAPPAVASPLPAASQLPDAAPRPEFDVVSVRRCLPGDELTGPPGGRGGGGAGRGPRFSPGRLRVQCLAVGDMIRIAYLGLFGQGLLNYNARPDDTKLLRSAPPWLNKDWYTVDGVTNDPIATGPTGLGHREAEQVMEQMLQRVLEDRFQLKIHRDTENVAMYNLTLAKGGLKLKPMEKGGCTERDPSQGVNTNEMFPPGKTPLCVSWIHMNGPDWALDSAGQKLGNLANALSNALNRHVFDKTGINDVFILHLQFAHDETTPGNFPPEMRDTLFPPTDVPAGPSIFTALEGLGLKLEPTTGPQGYIVIDHVERPTEN